jgi:hypothetical protein
MKLDGKLDEILDLFSNGDPFREVARKMGVSTRTLHIFLNKDGNKDAYHAIMQESSDSYASKAEEVLMSAPADKYELQRARDLAHHYRWMAAKRNPKKYGDKIDIDHTSGGEKIEPTRIVFGKSDNG